MEDVKCYAMEGNVFKAIVMGEETEAPSRGTDSEESPPETLKDTP